MSPIRTVRDWSQQETIASSSSDTNAPIAQSATTFSALFPEARNYNTAIHDSSNETIFRPTQATQQRRDFSTAEPALQEPTLTVPSTTTRVLLAAAGGAAVGTLEGITLRDQLREVNRIANLVGCGVRTDVQQKSATKTKPTPKIEPPPPPPQHRGDFEVRIRHELGSFAAGFTQRHLDPITGQTVELDHGVLAFTDGRQTSWMNVGNAVSNNNPLSQSSLTISCVGRSFGRPW